MNTELAGSPIDKELALSRVGGDAELLKEIAILFLEDYPKVIADLHAAAARGDAMSVERTAHSLKGSVANFGAKAAIETALEIENLGRTRRIGDVAPLLQALERALAAIKPELEAL
jgi:two-component system, sensor histidine kinase and response regulator